MLALPPPGSRVAFYSRFSTPNQPLASIEGQERLCAGYSEKQGWIETGRFSDAMRTGATTVGRSGLFKMLMAAEEGRFDVLLVEDIDRTSRDAADMFQIAKELEEMDIVMCTVAGGVVTDMELAFKAVQNQQYLKQSAFKVKRGQELVVASGRMSGSVAYGYKKALRLDAKGEPINGYREINPETAPVVQRIHRDLDAGVSTFAICAALNAEGIPGPKGGLWRPGALLGNRHGGIGILRNPQYIGEFQFRKTQRKRRKGKIKMRFTAESERIITYHPELAIIDRDLWDRNQARLAENYDRPFHTKKKVQYVLTGKVFCGWCGESCTVCDGRYLCTGHVFKGVCANGRRARRQAVETSIFSRVKDHLLSDELLGPCLDAYREEAERALAEHAARAQGATTRLADIDQRISNLMAQLGASSEASFASQMLLAEVDKLGAEKARLEHEVRQAPRPVGPAMDVKAIVERIRATLEDLQQALESKDREAARAQELMRGLIDKVVLMPAPGSVADGRGAGDMIVTVEGPLAALIDLADLSIDRVTKYGHRPMSILDSATLVWRFAYILEWRDPRLRVVYADLPVVAKLLDQADKPVTMAAIAEALAGAGADASDDEARSPSQRARNVVAYLQAHGFTRCVVLSRKATGYLWNETGDDEDDLEVIFAKRLLAEVKQAAHTERVPVPVIVIGPRRGGSASP